MNGSAARRKCLMASGSYDDYNTNPWVDATTKELQHSVSGFLFIKQNSNRRFQQMGFDFFSPPIKAPIGVFSFLGVHALLSAYRPATGIGMNILVWCLVQQSDLPASRLDSNSNFV